MYNGYGFIYMIIAQILFFIITIGLIILIIRGSKRESNKKPKGILDERLVKGDITKKEYEAILKIIRDSEVKK